MGWAGGGQYLLPARGLIRAGFWAWFVVVTKAPPGTTVPSPSLSVCLVRSESDLDAVSRDCLAVPMAEKEMMSAQMQPSTLLFRPGLN